MSTIYWIVFGLMCATGLLWLLNLLVLIARGRDMEYRVTADADPDAPSTGEQVSVIIPARNEEGNIGPCLERVLAQTYQTFEVIVLNDRSEDNTQAELDAITARDDRVRGIMGQERPEGWMGKVWACHVAQREARGDVLLFIDADVRLEPEALRQALAYLRRKELGALSVFGKLKMVTFWEWAVQPLIGGLIIQNNDPRDVNDPSKPDKISLWIDA